MAWGENAHDEAWWVFLLVKPRSRCHHNIRGELKLLIWPRPLDQGGKGLLHQGGGGGQRVCLAFPCHQY